MTTTVKVHVNGKYRATVKQDGGEPVTGDATMPDNRGAVTMTKRADDGDPFNAGWNAGVEAEREPTAASRQIAFVILTQHGDCLLDDVSLNDLIDDIAAAIDAAKETK